MPRGRKLSAPHVALNMDDVRRWFAENDTRCESQVHPPDDAPPASNYLRTDWSFAFLCDACGAHVLSLSEMMRVTWELRLAEHLWQVMARRSYTEANTKSGFVLEEVIAERNATVKQIEQLATTERSAAQREIRKAIRESPTKVGMADEDLLTARQRQAKRVQAGAPTLGPKRIDRGSVLRARLIAPPQRSEQEGT